ncbi:MAG: nucleotide exchange factor GrpE, partial [Nitrospinota bacterium]
RYFNEQPVTSNEIMFNIFIKREIKRHFDKYPFNIDDSEELSNKMVVSTALDSNLILEDIKKEIRRVGKEVYKLNTSIEDNKNTPDMKWISMDIIKIVDGLEGAIENLDESLQDVSGNNGFLDRWKEGILIISERARELLQKMGIKEIKSVGSLFNPEMHRAVDKEYKKDFPENIILKEEVKGYILNGKVLRYSDVVVNQRSLVVDQ